MRSVRPVGLGKGRLRPFSWNVVPGAASDFLPAGEAHAGYRKDVTWSGALVGGGNLRAMAWVSPKGVTPNRSFQGCSFSVPAGGASYDINGNNYTLSTI